MPIINQDITDTITVKTTPEGFEEKIELILTGTGNIIRDSQSKEKWIYTAPLEDKTDIGVKEIDHVTINSKILGIASTKSIRLNIASVFYHYGTNNNNRDKAWQYAKWKYDIPISNLNSISYVASQSTGGLTNNYTKNMTLGTGAFSEEWSCASIIGHENVHGAQPFLLSTPKREQEACMWELDHSNAPNCKASPLTYIYDYCRYYYEDTKDYYRANAGSVDYP